MDQQDSSAPKIERGRITDEAVAQMRRRIGWPNPTIRTGTSLGPWNTVATPDAIRHWPMGYGDDNPLFTDPAYGARTRWKSQIAAPWFEKTLSRDVTPQPPEDLHRETRGALRGVQLFNSGLEVTWYRPIYPGDATFRSLVVHSVEEKKSEFAGRSVLVTNRSTDWNLRSEVIAVSDQRYIHAERKKVSKESKYAGEKPASYTDEQLAEIERAYDAEFRRGAETLYYEDIEEGAELPKMVKGPLTITDMLNLYMGGGWLSYVNPPLRLGYENRKKVRGLYNRNQYNAWDVIQRVHWDADMAREVGVPMMYDIGPMRWTWLIHYCTNFGGDDAWLYKLRGEWRRFNYYGDTTWLTARVVRKAIDEALGCTVEIEITGTNQRGAQNAGGTATLLVASRERGPALLPPAPRIPPPERFYA